MFRIRFFLFFQIPKGMFKVLGSKTIAEFIQFQIPMGIFSAFLIRSIVSSWRFKSQWEFSAHDKNETWLNDEEFQIPMGIFSICLIFQKHSLIEVSNPNGKIVPNPQRECPANKFLCRTHGDTKFQIPTGLFSTTKLARKSAIKPMFQIPMGKSRT